MSSLVMLLSDRLKQDKVLLNRINLQNCMITGVLSKQMFPHFLKDFFFNALLEFCFLNFELYILPYTFAHKKVPILSILRICTFSLFCFFGIEVQQHFIVVFGPRLFPPNCPICFFRHGIPMKQ